MWRAERDECPGSRGEPVETSVVVGDDRSETGECPVCGARLALGYALLLPVHDRRAGEPESREPREDGWRETS